MHGLACVLECALLYTTLRTGIAHYKRLWRADAQHTHTPRLRTLLHVHLNQQDMAHSEA